MIIGTVLTRDGAVSVSQPGGCPSAVLEGEPDAVPAVGEPGGRTKGCVRYERNASPAPRRSPLSGVNESSAATDTANAAAAQDPGSLPRNARTQRMGGQERDRVQAFHVIGLSGVQQPLFFPEDAAMRGDAKERVKDLLRCLFCRPPECADRRRERRAGLAQRAGARRAVGCRLRGAPEIPVLALVGDADPLADRAALAQAVKVSLVARLSVVHGAHHHVLNDKQHRSVAAEIVSFLETFGNELIPVISVESHSW
jgi:pimeloyl-ACP methyl ester carboxylesterase